MKQYLDLLKHVKENGTYKSDRTGTGTQSVFGYQMRFNLQDGFPLVTTKKCHLRSIIHELLWFLQGDTNVKYLQDNKVTIWDEWRQPWTFNRDIVEVKKISKDFQEYSGNFSYDGIGFPADSLEQKLAGTWKKMMQRCYDKASDNYKFYGEKGISVCKHWHDPKNFISDVQKIPHWRYKLKNWNDFELDKDYFDSNQYDPNTCIWLHKKENVPYNWIKITKPDGEVLIVDGYTNASKAISCSRSSIHRFVNNDSSNNLKGNNKIFKDWKFEEINNDNSDILYRRKIIDDGDLGPVYGKQWRSWPTPDGQHIDQISNVIKQLKEDPDSRRIIVSAWNVGELHKMALAPCHAFFQFYVADGKLSCQLYQRSADIFLGVPFNIASYALLVHMMAQQCDLEVGDFVWTGGDCHIYSNHTEQVDLQLSREPRALPKLVIKRKPDSIFDYTFDDFEIEGYDPHPAIKAPVAV